MFVKSQKITNFAAQIKQDRYEEKVSLCYLRHYCLNNNDSNLCCRNLWSILHDNQGKAVRDRYNQT